MSVPRQPRPAKLVVSMFMKEKDLLRTAGPALTRMFGPVDLMSAWLPFDFTSYYEKEMGAPLYRRVLAFRRLMNPASLPRIKLQTNDLEHTLTDIPEKRRINIDPGYLSSERFVLATGKNFTHRIYLAKGIYADLTLIYQRKAFRPLPWTYPDYADDRMHQFLERIRKKYCMDLKSYTETTDVDFRMKPDGDPEEDA